MPGKPIYLVTKLQFKIFTQKEVIKQTINEDMKHFYSKPTYRRYFKKIWALRMLRYFKYVTVQTYFNQVLILVF
jgi:hypothetical protein